MICLKLLTLYLIIVNALGFLLMIIDKSKAKHNRWRIPEATLLGVGAIGGSLGCIIAMRTVRHKTKHPQFSIGLPVMLVIQFFLLYFLFWR